jgi:PEGA domain
MNPTRMKRPQFIAAVVIIIFSLVSFAPVNAKEAPPQVLVWPTTGTPVVRFTFSKFKETGSSGKNHIYSTQVTAENLWTKQITSLEFALYVYDKNKVRVGDSWLSISDVSPGAIVKFETTVNAAGVIDSMEIVPRTLPVELQPLAPPKAISMTVNSVPQGADFKLDGTPAGTTPKIIQVTPGKHVLAFTKEGFTPGMFPFETTTDSASGGTVSYELGTAAHDTVELRDGSVLSGDVESMTATDVVIRVGGTNQQISRNQVKRISLIQRDAL